jgi:energy-coupling factor transporter ATP-binding protein EcfA2
MISARAETEEASRDSRKMLTSLQIQGYRVFNQFEMSDLGLVNLLVGTNNSGKTSVLEAIYLLASRGDPYALWQILWKRGERTIPDRESKQRPQTEYDVHHLFTGHEFQAETKFSVSAKNQIPEQVLTFAISEMSAKQRMELFGPADDATLPSRLVLQIKGNPPPVVSLVPLTRAGGITPDVLESPPRRIRRRHAETTPAQFITPESLTGNEVQALWNRISLTPDEELVLNALQFLEHDLERVAVQTQTPPYYNELTRGGFIAKIKQFEHPVPIGSLGDGTWRMLAMAAAITQCKEGFLLVDEIDAGLHYTVMADMWRLIHHAAKRFNVQVFATTHSYDCVYSLAPICTSVEDGHRVTVQRIEMGKSKAVPYSEDEIKIAAERGLEIR